MFQPETDKDGLVTQNYCSLTPAYGRDYKSKKAVEADWLAEKDFIHQPSGKYINRQQFARGVWVNIRYSQQRKIAVVKA